MLLRTDSANYRALPQLRCVNPEPPHGLPSPARREASGSAASLPGCPGKHKGLCLEGTLDAGPLDPESQQAGSRWPPLLTHWDSAPYTGAQILPSFSLPAPKPPPSLPNEPTDLPFRVYIPLSSLSLEMGVEEEIGEKEEKKLGWDKSPHLNPGQCRNPADAARKQDE